MPYAHHRSSPHHRYESDRTRKREPRMSPHRPADQARHCPIRCGTSNRTEDWLKLKCKKRQEFVIIGYYDRVGAIRQVGSLILGVYDHGTLIPVGSVGTGWNSDEASELKVQLAKIEQSNLPFSEAPKKPGRW